jgi:hypothetical protein
MSVSKAADGPGYYASAETAERMAELGMPGLLEDFARDGYGVIHDAADAAFIARLREAIKTRATPGGSANFSYSASLLLGQDPVFEEAVLNPKVLAVVEAVCGKGAMLSQLLGSVRVPGPDKTRLHADQSWMPEPFPEHTLSITMCWALDEYTLENGATSVIPGSHLERRFPTSEEAAKLQGLQPILCEAGAIACWLGETWHGNYPRVTPGERVVLHMTFSRISLRPVENYDHLDDAWLEGKPAALTMLLGREGFLDMKNTDRNAPDYLQRVRTTQAWGREDTFRVKSVHRQG